MANVTVTFTITEFCLHTGISEEELNEIVGLGVVEPREIETTRVFDDHAAIVVQRAVRLRHELALDWPGIAVALTLMDDIAHLKQGKPPATPAAFPVCSSSVMCVCRM